MTPRRLAVFFAFLGSLNLLACASGRGGNERGGNGVASTERVGNGVASNEKGNGAADASGNDKGSGATDSSVMTSVSNDKGNGATGERVGNGEPR